MDNIVLRINELMNYYNLSQKQLSQKSQVDSSHLSKVLNGRLECGSGVKSKLLLAFPNVNRDWLLYGKGEMLKVSQSMGDVNNSVVVGANFSGNGNNITHNDSINEMIGLLKKKDEQIDRLLTIIEKMGK